MLSLLLSPYSFQAGVTLKAPAASGRMQPVMVATGIKQVQQTPLHHCLCRPRMPPPLLAVLARAGP